MSISTKYVINKNYIPNLPQIPFRNGIGQYEGVVMHATASWNDSANGERNYETNHFEEAFVTTFSDETQILEVSDPNYICWGTNHSANELYLSNELCQSHDHNIFLLAYDRWVWLAAYQLFQRKLGVIDNQTLSTHHQCTIRFKEGSHTDPDDYLKEHGVTWQQVLNDVTNYYNQFEEEERMIEQLQAQVQALSAEVEALKEYNSMNNIPLWALNAVQAAENKIVTVDGQTIKIMNDPNGRSFDMYALVTMLYRLGLLN